MMECVCVCVCVCVFARCVWSLLSLSAGLFLCVCVVLVAGGLFPSKWPLQHQCPGCSVCCMQAVVADLSLEVVSTVRVLFCPSPCQHSGQSGCVSFPSTAGKLILISFIYLLSSCSLFLSLSSSIPLYICLYVSVFLCCSNINCCYNRLFGIFYFTHSVVQCSCNTIYIFNACYIRHCMTYPRSFHKE